ncbi:uncharacterized protein LOC129941194 [Eupeodes corollae]|uniref:uncharacterized protein LOC129941194 n=1 Tax=Eupeodes corollae TaxID=290404 RepID=UPI00249170DF|nr:uncharacterized protein LOC129941194 [Eupeodes corollae]
MSKRQTQSVSPLARKRDRLTVVQPELIPGEMEASEGQIQISQNTPNAQTADSENQSIISLLKIVIENQQKQSAPLTPFPCNQFHTLGPHCHCQVFPNNCPNQIANSANTPAINEESSIKSLLFTMLKNQIQPNYGQLGFLRQPSSMQACQVHASFCQHQQNQSSLTQAQSSVPATSTTAATTSTIKKEELDEPSNNSLIMTILKNQTKMNAQLEKLIETQELIVKKLESQPVTTLFPIPNRINFKKIDSVKDCHEFEENLKNAEFAQNMLKHFESICGGSSDLYGDNVAYALIDHVFTRRLFTLVTWTGLSRGTESKECFLKFERVFQFFFDLIRRVDKDYSIKSLKDFFQKIISNSKRRFEHKRRRISRVKLSSGLIVKRKKRPIMPHKETISNYVDGEQEIISDEITDNDDDFKDNFSTYSNECNTDEVATYPEICIKTEDVED